MSSFSIGRPPSPSLNFIKALTLSTLAVQRQVVAVSSEMPSPPTAPMLRPPDALCAFGVALAPRFPGAQVLCLPAVIGGYVPQFLPEEHILTTSTAVQPRLAGDTVAFGISSNAYAANVTDGAVTKLNTQTVTGLNPSVAQTADGDTIAAFASMGDIYVVRHGQQVLIAGGAQQQGAPQLVQGPWGYGVLYESSEGIFLQPLNLAYDQVAPEGDAFQLSSGATDRAPVAAGNQDGALIVWSHAGVFMDADRNTFPLKDVPSMPLVCVRRGGYALLHGENGQLQMQLRGPRGEASPTLTIAHVNGTITSQSIFSTSFGFIVTWHSRTTQGYRIYLRAFEHDGDALDAQPRQLAASGLNNMYPTGQDADGTARLAWIREGQVWTMDMHYNDPPTWQTSHYKTTLDHATAPFDAEASDPDNDHITYVRGVDMPAWLNFMSNTGLPLAIVGQAPANMAGKTITFSIVADDGFGGRTPLPLTLEIPAFTESPSTRPNITAVPTRAAKTRTPTQAPTVKSFSTGGIGMTIALSVTFGGAGLVCIVALVKRKWENWRDEHPKPLAKDPEAPLTDEKLDSGS